MLQESLFSAVVGNRWMLGFFDVYPDLSCTWQYGQKQVSGRVGIRKLELDLYIERAEEEGKKYIAGAHVLEYSWNPRSRA
jgi:hypothetical protein